MRDGLAGADARLARAAAVLLLVATGIRSLASVVAGFVEWHDSANTQFGQGGRIRAADVLTTFGAAGDGTGILLVVAAAAAVWWLLRADQVGATALRLSASWAFAVVAVLVIMDVVGIALFDSITRQTSRTVVESGFALAYLVVAVGGVLLLQRYDAAVAELTFDDDDDEFDAFVFAVDRKSGDVRAFMSSWQAARGMHVYWVEDDEFAFYTDEGVVVEASVADGRIVLQPTDVVRRDELLTMLREFANRRGIRVDAADVDDPAAYAVPIARWQGLENWPPWMRPIGRLFQPRG